MDKSVDVFTRTYNRGHALAARPPSLSPGRREHLPSRSSGSWGRGLTGRGCRAWWPGTVPTRSHEERRQGVTLKWPWSHVNTRGRERASRDGEEGTAGAAAPPGKQASLAVRRSPSVKRSSAQVPPAPETCGEGRGPAHFTPRPRTTSAGSRNGEWPARSTWDFCDSLKWSQKQSGSFWAGEVSSHTRTPKQRVTFSPEQAKHTPRAGSGGMAPGSELTHHNPVPSQSLRSAALISLLFLPDSHACSL